jgi:hypothetical protein
MSAPVLPLTAARLNSLESVSIIAAWMLFPPHGRRNEAGIYEWATATEDEVSRNKIILRHHVQNYLLHLSNLPEESTVRFTPEELSVLLSTALEAGHRDEVEKMNAEREPMGAYAGYVLYEALPRLIRGEPRAMEDAKRRVEGIRKYGKATSTSELNNHRTKFKSVIALWVAYVEFCDADGIFPCAPEEVADFLSAAEAYRKRGEQTVAKQ